MSAVNRPARILDPGMCLTLRPMAYPQYFEMYRAAIKNTWTVDEVDFSTDTGDLRKKLTDTERHLVQRLVAFFATGDSIVANNLVLNLYRHINAPEARTVKNIRGYLEFCADQRLATLGMRKRYGAKNPLSFMDLQDVQEVTNSFERRVSAYQVGVSGEVVFDAAF